jgi:hypothetical protein
MSANKSRVDRGHNRPLQCQQRSPKGSRRIPEPLPERIHQEDRFDTGIAQARQRTFRRGKSCTETRWTARSSLLDTCRMHSARIPRRTGRQGIPGNVID